MGLNIEEALYNTTTDKPRLAEVLGVEVGQEFTVDELDYGTSTFRVDADGSLKILSTFGGIEGWHDGISANVLAILINSPHLIHTPPRWTENDIEDAKAVKQLFLDMAWVARNRDGTIRAFDGLPERCRNIFDTNSNGWFTLPNKAFPSVTWKNSPVSISKIKNS